MAYTNQANVEDYLGRVLTADEVAQLPSLIGTAQREIDSYTNRSFEATTSKARLFDIDNYCEAFIDDAQEITKVEVLNYDGSVAYEIPLSSVLTYPLNCEWISSLRITPGISYTALQRGDATLRVTAEWGTTATAPYEVVSCATQITALLINGFKAIQTSSLKRESIENYSVEYGGIAGVYDAGLASALKTVESWRKVSF